MASLQSHINAIEAVRYEINQDKSVPAKTRNKASSNLETAQAYLYKAMHDDPDYAKPVYGEDSITKCICPEGAIDRSCPVHA